MSIKEYSARMLDKEVKIVLTPAAAKQLEHLDEPLCVEMELYFSCLIRKQVRFREQPGSDFVVDVTDKLKLGFRPVMTKACSVHDHENAPPPLSDFPIQKPESYIPHWLKLDYRKGKWGGEFGYQNHHITA